MNILIGFQLSVMFESCLSDTIKHLYLTGMRFFYIHITLGLFQFLPQPLLDGKKMDIASTPLTHHRPHASNHASWCFYVYNRSYKRREGVCVCVCVCANIQGTPPVCSRHLSPFKALRSCRVLSLSLRSVLMSPPWAQTHGMHGRWGGLEKHTGILHIHLIPGHPQV